MRDIVLGATLSDAQEYANDHGLPSPHLVSPMSFYKRGWCAPSGALHVTNTAFDQRHFKPVLKTLLHLQRKKLPRLEA